MENYIVSARKYRPSAFESVVGQRALTETLRNAIRSGHLAHAYLFCGPRGVGKTTCARIFAKTINCLTPTAEHDACNECESCRAFNEQRSMNIHELDAASNNSVDDIRSLIEQVRIPPQVGKYSVYIIDEVHMLSQGAFNALLKTLEEPPSYAIFILATTEKHKVLATILSRCQVFDFSRITISDTVRHLQYVAESEGVKASEEALNVVAQKADGGMRDALSIFDQLVTFCGKEITYEQAIGVLNVLDTDYYFRLVDDALTANTSDALLLFDEVLSKGFDAGHFITGFASHLRNVLVSKDAATVQLLEVSDAVRKHYADQAAKCSPVWILKMLDVVAQCDINYRTARNKRLTVELALLKCCALAIPEMNATSAAVPVASKASTPAAQTTPVQSVRQDAAPRAQVVASPASTPATPSAPAAPSVPAARPAVSVPSATPRISMPGGGAASSVSTQNGSTPQPAQASVPQAPSQQNTPFTAEQLAAAWNKVRRLFPEDERFLAMLSNIAPNLISYPQCELLVMNCFQEKDVREKLAEIVAFMRKELNNNLITFSVRVEEKQSENLAYTPQEKLKALTEMNPLMGDLSNSLDLRLN